MKRFLVVCVLAGSLPATGLAQPQESAGSKPTLASLVEELNATNPELAGARREVDMRVARIAPAGAPPDPTLSIGAMQGFTRPPFFPSSNTPDAFWRVGASQEIPFPGKLTLRSRIAAADADASRPVPLVPGGARQITVSETEGDSEYLALILQAIKTRGSDDYAFRVSYTL